MSSPNPTTPDPLAQVASCCVCLPWSRANELVTTCLLPVRSEPVDPQDSSDHLPDGFETKWTLSYELCFEPSPLMIEWAKENLTGGWKFERVEDGAVFTFDQSKDAIMFRLRWS